MMRPVKRRGFRKGMALPMTLIVLLVAGGMVAISFYFIENMMTTTKMKARDELRLNFAASGLERGKAWLMERLDADETPALITAGAIESVTSSDNYKELLVAVSGDVLEATNPTISFTEGDVDIKVSIYDLAYDFIPETLKFERNIPPRMYRVREGGSMKAGQSYASSNAGEGNPGSGSYEKKILKAYLVKSVATTKDGLVKSVEQALFVSPK